MGEGGGLTGLYLVAVAICRKCGGWPPRVTLSPPPRCEPQDLPFISTFLQSAIGAPTKFNALQTETLRTPRRMRPQVGVTGPTATSLPGRTSTRFVPGHFCKMTRKVRKVASDVASCALNHFPSLVKSFKGLPIGHCSPPLLPLLLFCFLFTIPRCTPSLPLFVSSGWVGLSDSSEWIRALWALLPNSAEQRINLQIISFLKRKKKPKLLIFWSHLGNRCSRIRCWKLFPRRNSFPVELNLFLPSLVCLLWGNFSLLEIFSYLFDVGEGEWESGRKILWFEPWRSSL